MSAIQHQLFLSSYTAAAVAAGPDLSLDFLTALIDSAGAPDADAGTTPLTYTGASHKRQCNADGVLEYAPHNLYLNSETPATQGVTVVSGLSYTLKVTGSVSITLSGAGTGTATAGSDVVFTASTTTATCTLNSGTGTAQLRLTNAPDLYIATGGSSVYGSRAGTRNRKPVTNYMQNPEVFDGATLQTTLTDVSGSEDPPIDGMAVYEFTESTGTGAHAAQQTYPETDGADIWTWSAFVKANGRDWFQFRGGGSSNRDAWFDLANGVVGTVDMLGSFTFDAGITPVVGRPGWYRIWLTFSLGTTAGPKYTMFLSNGDGDAGTSYTGDGTSGILIAGSNFTKSGIEDYIGAENLSVFGDKAFTSSWVVTQGTMAAGSITAPDGSTTTGSLLTADTGTGLAYLYGGAFTHEATKQYTQSVFVKDVDAGYAWIGSYDGTSGWGVLFDLSAGTVVGERTGVATVDDSGIVHYGNGWYRIWITYTTSGSPSSTPFAQQFGMGQDATLDWSWTLAGEQCHFWGFQHNEGGLMPYVGMPQTAYVRAGYLAEAAVTNFCSDSHFLSPSGAGYAGTPGERAPDGSLNGVKAQCTTPGDPRYLNISTVSSGNFTVDSYTQSVMVKYDGTQYFVLEYAVSSDAAITYFDLLNMKVESTHQTGVATVDGGGVIPLGDGWMICWQTFTKSSAEWVFSRCYSSQESSFPTVHTTSDAFIVWGAQVEQGTYPSSLVFTNGASDSRSADLLEETAGAYIDGTDDSFVFDYSVPGKLTNGVFMKITGATEQVDILHLPTNYLRLRESGGAAGIVFKDGAFDGSGRYKLAASISNLNFDGGINGRAPVSNSTAHANLGAFTKLSFPRDVSSIDQGPVQIRSYEHYGENRENDVILDSKITDDGTTWRAEL